MIKYLPLAIPMWPSLLHLGKGYYRDSYTVLYKILKSIWYIIFQTCFSFCWFVSKTKKETFTTSSIQFELL